MQLSAEIVAEVARNPALAKTFGANQQQLTEALEQVITLAQQGEVIAPALNPRELAQLILDAIESHAWRQTIFPSCASTAVTPNPLLEQLIFR
ncbi:hypothetical protein D3C79_812600 [compost metagenome]